MLHLFGDITKGAQKRIDTRTKTAAKKQVYGAKKN
jgi:hypothetical protein